MSLHPSMVAALSQLTLAVLLPGSEEADAEGHALNSEHILPTELEQRDRADLKLSVPASYCK